MKNKKIVFAIVIIIVGLLLIGLDNMIYLSSSRSRDTYRSDTDSYSSYDYDYDYSYDHSYVDDRCKSCYGTGACSSCNGSHIVRAYGVEVECPNCNMYGDCSRCGGTGKIR